VSVVFLLARPRRALNLAVPLSGAYSELRGRQPHLASAALLCLIALVPVLLAYGLDVRTINGISVWTKPAKFLVSFVVYYATLAWVFGYLPRAVRATRSGRVVVWLALGAGVYEIAWLLLAAASGVPSHFNDMSRTWSIAYNVAGIGSVALIAAILLQGLLVARAPGESIAPAMRTALLIGAIVTFVATLITAGYLASGTGHWVGGAHSDAAGLPVMGWSRTGGDLRVAHFWALHAQQAIPLVGWALVLLGRPNAASAVRAAAVAYAALIAFTFWQALRGEAFLAWIG
jgi:hypothetical protein